MIDNENYDTDCYDMPDKHIDDELIVGMDVINQSKLNMTKYGIKMIKIKYDHQNEILNDKACCTLPVE